MQTGVEGLAFVETGGEDRSEGGVPLGVGDDDGGGAVVVGDLQLGDEGLVGAVEVAVSAVEADTAAVPAVAEPGADGVGALGEMVGHVVGAVAQALAVHRPARGQCVVADAAAVDLCLIQAMCRDVQAGACDRCVEGEVPADAGRAPIAARILGPGGADGDGPPVGCVQQSGLDCAGHAPRGWL